MTSFSSFKSRRLHQKQTTNTHHLLAFSLGSEWFAISVFDVIKVIPLEKIYGRPAEGRSGEASALANSLGLTRYQDQEILVIDLPSLLGFHPVDNYAYLLIIQLGNDLVGLPLSNPPVIHRVTEDNFAALPPNYLAKSKIARLSSQVIKIPYSSPLFLLDVNKLINSTS